MDKWVENKQLQVHFVSAAGLVYKDGKVLSSGPHKEDGNSQEVLLNKARRS